jgi:nicotinic acid mononucleotide adenylyltransferase
MSRIKKSYSYLGITSLNLCSRINESYSNKTLRRANFQALVQDKEILGITSQNSCSTDKSYSSETLRRANFQALVQNKEILGITSQNSCSIDKSYSTETLRRASQDKLQNVN